MPELSRFGGMVIYMLFRDDKQHHKPHVHVYYGAYTKLQSVWMVNFWEARCPENNTISLLAG